MSSRNDIFQGARMKLTAFYTGSVLFIVMIFSLGIYLYFGSEITGDFEYEGEDIGREQALEQEFIDTAEQRLRITLLAVDFSAMFVAVSLGWLLAGKTLKPIQISMEQQKQFIADAAHELRTPLAVIKAGLETVEIGSKPTQDDYRQLNNELHEEIDRVVALTNDLLFLARSDQYAQHAECQEIDLAAVCSRQVNLMFAFAEQKGVGLNANIAPGTRILGNEGQLGQLVLNLLKNAIDYNQPGGDVSLSLKSTGAKATLVISDTGIGIDQDELKHVFRRFHKADTSRERSGAGAGLGLSIVREIVSAHGGDISMESELGSGTRATVVFNQAD